MPGFVGRAVGARGLDQGGWELGCLDSFGRGE